MVDLIEQREEARKSRDFSTADTLRDALQIDYGVAVDDETREWWVGQRQVGPCPPARDLQPPTHPIPLPLPPSTFPQLPAPLLAYHAIKAPLGADLEPRIHVARAPG